MSGFLTGSVYFGVVLSLAAYEIGRLLQKKCGLAIVNPLLVATALVIAVIRALGVDYDGYLSGAKYLSYLLTPATICLAVPLYEQLALLKRHALALASGVVSGILASAFSIFVLARLFGLTHAQYVTLIPKSITTAIGMGVSETLGGVVTITVAAIIVTGIVGNLLAEWLFRLLRITEPVARGLALGAASHAFGTVKALELGEVEGAMSSLALTVSGVLTAVAASFFAQLM